MYEGENDPYIDGSTDILKNLLGITNAQEFECAEYNIAYARSSDLYRNVRPTTPFDIDHLKAIHRHLFHDIFSWAGEIRTIDISKGHTRVASAITINSAGIKLFKDLEKEKWLKGTALDTILREITLYHPLA
jgi:cell filamentation protein